MNDGLFVRWGPCRNLWVCGAPRPEGLTMSLRAHVEVRLDVAEIIRWIVIGYYLLT
jgi:hypothetical protein